MIEVPSAGDACANAIYSAPDRSYLLAAFARAREIRWICWRGRSYLSKQENARAATLSLSRLLKGRKLVSDRLQLNTSTRQPSQQFLVCNAVCSASIKPDDYVLAFWLFRVDKRQHEQTLGR